MDSSDRLGVWNRSRIHPSHKLQDNFPWTGSNDSDIKLTENFSTQLNKEPMANKFKHSINYNTLKALSLDVLISMTSLANLSA